MSTPCFFCVNWRPTINEHHSTDDQAAQCTVKGRYTTKYESCECSQIWNPALGTRGGINESVTVSKPATADGAARASIRERTATSIAQRRGVVDSEFDGPPMYLHQQEALQLLKANGNWGGLGMEMGTGKSRTVLELATEFFKKREIDRLLIIAPNQVHRQWATEQCPLWLKVHYDCQCLYGNGGAKKAYVFDDDTDTLQVVCVNIDTFSQPTKWKDIAAWACQGKSMVVLDEADNISNVTSNRSQNIMYGFSSIVKNGKTVKQNVPLSAYRYALTGTPVANSPTDIWAIMEFLQPGHLKRNYYSFKRHYGMFTQMAVNDRIIEVPLTEDWWHAIKRCKSFFEAQAICGCSEDTFNWIQAQEKYEGAFKHADELKAQINKCWYFKKLKDCTDMPEQIYLTREIEMSKEQRECYDSMRDEFIAQYETHTATALNKMTAYIRLQQISSGFISDKTVLETVVTDDELLNSDLIPQEIKWIGNTNPKLEALYRDVKSSAKPVIITTRYTAEADRIYNDLVSNYSCCMQTGWKRVGTIDDFKEGKYDVMVANIASIYRGFNLQNSHVILKYSNTFSLKYDEQLDGRIFRIGQKEPCEYISYINKDSIDEKIVSSLALKRNLLEFIRGSKSIREVL